MKRGDVYYGELASYPVLPDSQKEKDFLIKSASDTIRRVIESKSIDLMIIQGVGPFS